MPVTKIETCLNDLLGQHIMTVEKCVVKARNAVMSFFAENIEKTSEYAKKTAELKDRADALSRSIFEHLTGETFLPNLRDDIQTLVNAANHLAGLAKNLGNATVGEKPHMPKQFHQQMLEILEMTARQVHDLRRAMVAFFRKSESASVVMEHISKICEAERHIDAIEAELDRGIFACELPQPDKLAIKQYLTQITKLSNHAKDVSDSLSEIVVKLQL